MAKQIVEDYIYMQVHVVLQTRLKLNYMYI